MTVSPASGGLTGRSRALAALRWTLWAGAAYDFFFAVVMVVAPDVPANLLSLPLPGEPFWLYLMAIFLCMIGGCYLLAAYDPVAYKGIIVIAIVGRATGAAMFAWVALQRPDLSGLWVVAASDVAFALAHAVFWWPLRR
ncbi:MAG: hypothetical protein AAGD38_10400 [Acidobacteriota bacterium]